MEESNENNEPFDVVVIGGGSAGLCASVAASRHGGQDCRVALIEKSGCLGGMGPLANVHTFCGLYHPDTSRPPRVANRGLPTEIESIIRLRTGQESPTVMGRVYVLQQHPEIYDEVAKDLVLGEKDRIDLMLRSECVAVRRECDGRFLVQVKSEKGERTLHCRSVVDCSANALVAKFLGIPRQRAGLNQLQRPAFIFSIQGVTEGEPGMEGDRFNMRLALDLVHAVRDGELPEQVLGATLRHSVNKGECFVSLDLDSKEVTWNPSDPAAVDEIDKLGRSLAVQLCVFLKKRYTGFEHIASPGFPPAVGVRESYTWVGQHTLTADELIEGESFTDVVAYASWPIEMREDAKGPKFTYFKNEESSEIPLRSLVSADIPGVYFAGRCLSATHEALASVRVMGTCFAMGQAAGMAATFYAQGITDVDEQAGMIQAV